MTTSLEELKTLQVAEKIADEIWSEVLRWKNFEKRVVGEQLTRSADSIGANIAEAFGRYHYGDKLKFLFYARGSLFEAKYWINRASKRNLIAFEKCSALAMQLSTLPFRSMHFPNLYAISALVRQPLSRKKQAYTQSSLKKTSSQTKKSTQSLFSNL